MEEAHPSAPAAAETDSANPTLTEVKFSIKAPSAGLGQEVCLVGDAPALGKWKHEKAVPLTTSPENFPRWTCKVLLERDAPVTYKYFIREGNTLVSWESWKENRTVVPVGLEIFVDDGVFGEESKGEQEDPALNVWEEAHGWLVNDIQLRIRLGAKHPYNPKKPRRPPFVLKNKAKKVHKIVFSSQDPRITPKAVVLPQEDELKEHTFHALHFENLALYVDVYSATQPAQFDGQQALIGRAFIAPHQLKDLCGTITVPIVTPLSLQIVGDFTFEYLVVTPFKHRNLKHVMARTYWKSTKVVEIGHRGFGANDALSKSGKRTRISENTILSFVAASQYGRDSIEFDVQITSDGVPVIYHDFLIPVDAKGQFLMSINQLTVEQFKEIGISVMRGKSKNIIKNQPRTLRDMPTKNGAEGNGDKKKQDSLQQQLQQLESQQQSGQPTNASSAENQHQKSKKKMSKEHKAQLLERRRSFGDVVDKQFLKELEEEERLEEERMRAEKKASKTPPQIREEEASTQQQEDDFEKIKVPVLEECEISVEKAKARAREKVKKQRSHVTFTVPHPQVQDTFATLEEVFSLVPKHTGLNIEVKYPTEEEIADGVYYYERNKTVDAILKVVFDFAHEQRRIVWSSFDPDICIMLSLKQPRYPVLFLTAAGTQVLLDQRMNSLQQAVRFAKSVNLLGIVSKVTPLLMSPSLIKIIKSSGLLLATYGADNNEEENRKLQEKWGVDFIISDHANPVQRKLVLAAPSQPSSDPLLSVPVLPSH